MYMWRVNKLIAEFRVGNVSERQQLYYLLLFMGLTYIATKGNKRDQTPFIFSQLPALSSLLQVGWAAGTIRPNSSFNGPPYGVP